MFGKQGKILISVCYPYF